jgi:hypothetical protein
MITIVYVVLVSSQKYIMIIFFPFIFCLKPNLTKSTYNDRQGEYVTKLEKKNHCSPTRSQLFLFAVGESLLFPHVYLHEICILLLYRMFSIRV